MLGLGWTTPPEWVARVGRRPLSLLSDHAHCELKAAASAQSIVARNPGRRELVEALAAVAAEELEHFQRVVAVLHGRGGELGAQEASPYADGLLSRSARTRRHALLDRLLVAQLIEARSCERFQLLAEYLEDRGLAELYRSLTPSEAGHQALFRRLARAAYDPAVVEAREAELRAIEADVASGVPFGYRVHSGMAGGDVA